MKWIVLDTGKKSPAKNMAIDEAIMKKVKTGDLDPVIRFYDWEPAAVSIGYNQKAHSEVDFNILQEKGFGFVRRPTGGRMVLHKDEVTYSVIAPLKEKFDCSVTESYSVISKVLANGLESLGLNVSFERNSLSSSQQRLKGNPCFTSSSKYEIKCKEKKIIGSSQVRKGNVFLQHGSIMLNQNSKDITELLPDLSKREKKIMNRFLLKKTIAINEYLDYIITYDKVVSSLKEAFLKNWKDDIFLEKDLSDLNIDTEINKINFEKYASNEWNFKK